MSISKRNAHYPFTETVKVVIEVEVGYTTQEAREDALRAAVSLVHDLECGGGSRNGCYNAVRLGKSTVEAVAVPS